MGQFWGHFWIKMGHLCEKRGFKKCFKKRCPALRKHLPINMSGGSRGGGLACALYKQETIVRTVFEALFEISAEKSDLDSKSVQIVANKPNGLLTSHKRYEQKADYLTRPGQGPANFMYFNI